MVRRLFLDHPDSVGESYARHAGVAAAFGVRMIAGGLAALVHAAVPAWFADTGSRTVARLHGELVAKRRAQAEVRSVDYVI
jgi:hypothetical protein